MSEQVFGLLYCRSYCFKFETYSFNVEREKIHNATTTTSSRIQIQKDKMERSTNDAKVLLSQYTRITTTSTAVVMLVEEEEVRGGGRESILCCGIKENHNDLRISYISGKTCAVSDDEIKIRAIALKHTSA